MLHARTRGVFLLALGLSVVAFAQEPAKPTWQYSGEALRPFWVGEIVEGESVLFIKDEKSGEARASVLFPIREVLAVKNSVGDVTYENGKDFVWKPDPVMPSGRGVAASDCCDSEKRGRRLMARPVSGWRVGAAQLLP